MIIRCFISQAFITAPTPLHFSAKTKTCRLSTTKLFRHNGNVYAAILKQLASLWLSAYHQATSMHFSCYSTQSFAFLFNRSLGNSEIKIHDSKEPRYVKYHTVLLKVPAPRRDAQWSTEFKRPKGTKSRNRK